MCLPESPSQRIRYLLQTLAQSVGDNLVYMLDRLDVKLKFEVVVVEV